MELSRFFLHREHQPDLEIVEAAPSSEHHGAPILLIHGAFTGAWCWEEHFMRPFADNGRCLRAVSLRGHGRSEGRVRLAGSTLDDFVGDVVAACSSFVRAPVLIAHSLGGYLAQLLIGRVPMAGLVLLGSLPPDGMALVGPRLALTDPSVWLGGVLGVADRSSTAAAIADLQLLFGEGVPASEQRRFIKRMVPESAVALAQAHLPRWVTPAQAAALPTLVLQGAIDRLIWPETSLRTALYHGATHITLPAAGHFMMMDPSVSSAVSAIHRWLARTGL